MSAKKYTLIFFLFALMILSGCSNHKMQLDSSNLLISDTHNLEIVNLNNNNDRMVPNDIFLQNLYYDAFNKKIVSPGMSSEKPFFGLLFLTNDHSFESKSTKSFVPVHLYAYRNIYLMDSAQILHDENMQVTALGFYDVQAQKIISTIHIPGVVQDITGSGNKAFVSSYYPPQVAIEDKLVRLQSLFQSAESAPKHLM
jgi:hypothetical protein